MNRIICDICGSEYPENEERCPICSYPRQGNEKTVIAASAAPYTKIKGGRFSSKNVKKRRKEQLRNASVDNERDPNKPLIMIIIILLIAIILMTAYIAVRILGDWRGDAPVPQTTATTATTAAPTVPCAGIGLDEQVVELDNRGDQKQLGVRLQPADTTDTPVYVSADPSIVEVSETGLVTAVGSGQTTITITCGSVSKTCTVVCWFQEETTLPPETTAATEPAATEPKPTEPKATEPKATEPKPTEPKPTEPKVTEAPTLALDPEDVSCFNVGETFSLYVRLGENTVKRTKATWSTSDPTVATVDNGVVTAVGKGEATITAEYEGKKATCLVRCRFENPAPNEGETPDEGEEPEENQNSQTAADWKVRPSNDVSIVVGESFKLTVKNSSGETADAIWTMNLDGIVSVEGKTITGRAPGMVTLNTEVDGVSLSCIIRVSE